MKEDINSFLGRGFKFPIQADEMTGKMKMSEFEEDIKESVYIILMTRKGERTMKPEFGCGIHDFVFGNADYTTLSMMEREVREALTLWEPRIINLEVAVIPDREREGCLLVKIGYVVRSTNNPYNLVFPFYLQEGFK